MISESEVVRLELVKNGARLVDSMSVIKRLRRIKKVVKKQLKHNPRKIRYLKRIYEAQYFMGKYYRDCERLQAYLYERADVLNESNMTTYVEIKEKDR